MTRSELELAVYRRLQKNTGSIDTATQTRIRHFLNQRHRALLAMPGMARLRDAVITFASVASQSRYALANVSEVHRVWETTNDRELCPMSLADYRRASPDPSASTSTPSHYVFVGLEPVAKQPSNASELFIKSTSGSDTNTAYVEGEVTGGYPRSASVTMTGATAASLSASITTWERVSKVYLSAAAVGTVTLHEDSGVGTELASITIGKTSARYWVCYLYPQPSAVVTYTADVRRTVPDLGADTDEPWLPEEFHQLLEFGACIDELMKTDDPRYGIAVQEYGRLLGDLQYWIACQSGSGSQSAPASSLGAWYPSGS